MKSALCRDLIKVQIKHISGLWIKLWPILFNEPERHNYNHCDLFWKVVILTTSFETTFGVTVTAIVSYDSGDAELHSRQVYVGQLLSPGTTVSSTNKTDRHDIAEKLLKVALNAIVSVLYMETNNYIVYMI